MAAPNLALGVKTIEIEVIQKNGEGPNKAAANSFYCLKTKLRIFSKVGHSGTLVVTYLRNCH